VQARIIAVFEQLDRYDGTCFALAGGGIGRGEQLADAFRAGYFDDSGTGRDQNELVVTAAPDFAW
jgi:hypothetical protein